MIKDLSILLVEDDDVAAESVIRGVRKIAPDLPIIIAENGKEALDILNNNIESKQLNFPFIILLDLNMPVMNGLEFLEIVRKTEKFKDLIIFILTTSNTDTDKAFAYQHNVAGYMVKSAVGPQFSKLASLLKFYKQSVEFASKLN